jgi:phospholipase C
MLVHDVTSHPWNVRRFGEFLADAHCGALTEYSFIEPQFYPYLGVFGNPNDQHPPHNVLEGEKLIAQVYNAVRSSPCWKNSLLIITYDEHGGCYDHAPPPHAVPPDNNGSNGFYFDRYGVRVPAVIISPYIAPGSIVRSAPHGIAFEAPPYPFDHTSIIKTLRELFSLGPSLTRRDDAAPSLLPCLTPAPTNDGLPCIDFVKPEVSREANRALAHAEPNDNQTALAQVAMMLPRQQFTPGAVPQLQLVRHAVFENALTAGVHAVASLKSFLGL